MWSRAFFAIGLFASFAATSSSSIPRSVHISGSNFVQTSSNTTIVLAGPNVVVKGPPYLPFVNGSTICEDRINSNCSESGTCYSCTTFNLADVANLKARGWNAIRLGIVWAGAQPRDENSLDAGFLSILDDILSLCDANGIHVVLDNHGDMVGTANCGNGIPMWFQLQAAPSLIGTPLVTGFPYDLVGLQVTDLQGYSVCGNNASMWAQYAGDPNYNLLNTCCQAMNADGNPAQLGFTTLSQATMDYLINPGPGRDAFVRFWRLIAEAVVSHPSAFAAEFMNEPMTIRRTKAFDTWHAAGAAILQVIPDFSVSVMDVGEGILLPEWVIELIGGGELISNATMNWIMTSGSVFYAWHWYGFPSNATSAAEDARALGDSWGIPTFATEFMSCDAWSAAEKANISHAYWHYSAYCTTGASFGNRSVPRDTFGACILGWGDGNSAYDCSNIGVYR